MQHQANLSLAPMTTTTVPTSGWGMYPSYPYTPPPVEDIVVIPPSTSITIRQKAQKCPVCKGRGIVPSGFYLDHDDFSEKDVDDRRCHSCENGIIMVEERETRTDPGIRYPNRQPRCPSPRPWRDVVWYRTCTSPHTVTAPPPGSWTMTLQGVTNVSG